METGFLGKAGVGGERDKKLILNLRTMLKKMNDF